MYAVGENFEYLVDGEKLDISVIGDMMMFGDEYLIGEDLGGDKYVFIYREEDEMVELIGEEDESSEILDTWEEEYFAGGTDIGDWEEDSYYEREDQLTSGSDSSSEAVEGYFEVDDYSEAEEDMESFISGLMGG